MKFLKLTDAKRAIRNSLLSLRTPALRIRLMPEFIVIGAQRCGTTSLYAYLSSHPQVVPAIKKEVHFFDYNFGKGLDWYRSHFPRWTPMGVTGEATPYYMFHPNAAKRVYQVIPQTKLIMLLRNPIDRAYSHYHHEVRLGVESATFQEAIRLEPARINHEMERMLGDQNYYSFSPFPKL